MTRRERPGPGPGSGSERRRRSRSYGEDLPVFSGRLRRVGGRRRGGRAPVRPVLLFGPCRRDDPPDHVAHELFVGPELSGDLRGPPDHTGPLGGVQDG